jgi:hypothetical protein
MPANESQNMIFTGGFSAAAVCFDFQTLKDRDSDEFTHSDAHSSDTSLRTRQTLNYDFRLSLKLG